MYCAKCGKEIIAGGRFCSFCGWQVTDSQEKDLNGSAPDFKEEAQRRTREILDSMEASSRAKPKVSHLEINWDLGGMPTGEQKKTNTAQFNWDSVLEKKKQDKPGFTGFVSQADIEEKEGLMFKSPASVERATQALELGEVRQAADRLRTDFQTVKSENPANNTSAFGDVMDMAKSMDSEPVMTLADIERELFGTFEEEQSPVIQVNDEAGREADGEYLARTLIYSLSRQPEEEKPFGETVSRTERTNEKFDTYNMKLADFDRLVKESRPENYQTEELGDAVRRAAEIMGVTAEDEADRKLSSIREEAPEEIIPEPEIISEAEETAEPADISEAGAEITPGEPEISEAPAKESEGSDAGEISDAAEPDAEGSDAAEPDFEEAREKNEEQESQEAPEIAGEPEAAEEVKPEEAADASEPAVSDEEAHYIPLSAVMEELNAGTRKRREGRLRYSDIYPRDIAESGFWDDMGDDAWTATDAEVIEATNAFLTPEERQSLTDPEVESWPRPVGLAKAVIEAEAAQEKAKKDTEKLTEASVSRNEEQTEEAHAEVMLAEEKTVTDLEASMLAEEVKPLILEDDEDFDDMEEPKRKKHLFGKIIIGILILLLVCELFAVVICAAAPDSALAEMFNRWVDYVVSLLDGSGGEI